MFWLYLWSCFIIWILLASHILKSTGGTKYIGVTSILVALTHPISVPLLIALSFIEVKKET